MEIKIGDIKLTAEEAPRPIGRDRDTYIWIETLGDFSGTTKPLPKVLASELKVAIEALEKTCWQA